MLHRFVFCTLFAVVSIVTAAYGSACLTISVPEAVNRADVVLSGEVVDIHAAKRDEMSDILQPPKGIVVIRVDRVWKGVVGEEFEIALARNRNQESKAGQDWQDKIFAVGRKVLIYARRSDATAEYTVSMCSRTGLVSDSTKDIQELGQGKAPTKHESDSTHRSQR
jgi:hypothetical protein